jgi:peptidoglycan/LPS O-acetylase OafA/YrhL
VPVWSPRDGTAGARNRAATVTSVVTSPLDPSRDASLQQAAEAAGRFPALDGLRAIAALGVIATHVGFQTGRALDEGPLAPFIARLDYGVTVFFLLSGFLLFRPFVLAALTGRPRPSMRRYFRRRLLRILPAYWLAIAGGFLLIDANRSMPLRRPLLHLLLLQIYPSGELVSELAHTWTLAVEIAFYAVLPLLALVVAGKERRDPDAVVRRMATVGIALVVATYAFVLTVRWTGFANPKSALLWLPAYLDWFAIGMAIATVHAYLRTAGRSRHRWFDAIEDAARARGTCWLIALLLYWLATLPLAGPRTLVESTTWEWSLKHLLYAGSATFLLLPAVFADDGWLGHLLANRVMRFLGTVSYGIYLWHLLVMHFVVHALGYGLFQGSFVRVYLLTTVATVAVAAASYYAMERPLLTIGSARRH